MWFVLLEDTFMTPSNRVRLMRNHMTKCTEITLIDSLSRIFWVDLIPKHDFNYFVLKILASSCKASWIYNPLI